MYHKRKRNFTQKSYVERRKEYLTSSEYLEELAAREYRDITLLFSEMVDIANTATNDLTSMRALLEVVDHRVQALYALICYLDDTRCDEWSNTVSRLHGAITEFERAYARNTLKK